MTERRQYSHFAGRTFGEVGFAEGSAHGQVPDGFFNDPSDGFHEVEDESWAVWMVGVGEPDVRVEAKGVAGEGGFDFGESHPELIMALVGVAACRLVPASTRGVVRPPKVSQ